MTCRSLYDCGVIQPALEFFCTQLILHSGQQSEGFYMLCMVFIHRVLKCASFRSGSPALDLHTGSDQVESDALE